MKKIILFLVFVFHITLSQAFDIKILKVNFDTMLVEYKDENYTLVEVKSKIKPWHREITYLCIDNKLKAVAIRLYVRNDGSFIKVQRYVGRK